MLSTWRTCCSCLSQRWIFALFAFGGLLLGNSMRVILSISITEMVTTAREVIRSTDQTCVAFEKPTLRNVTIVTGKTYDWDEYTQPFLSSQGIILSSYFWGYAATQFPFGSLSERFGGKYLMGMGIFIPSMLTFCLPSAVYWGESSALIALRVLMGVISGAMYPAVSTMIAKWTVPGERSKLGGFIYAGAVLGTVFGTTMPAVIIRYSGKGWPAVFYFFGALGMIWFPFWVLLTFNEPEQHPYISEAELNYLQENQAERQKKKKAPPAPWGHILASKQFWAFVMALVGCDWAYFTMASDLPKYMSNVVKFSIEDNGYLSALPYLCMWFSTLVSSWLSNKILERGLISRTNVLKLLASISLMGPGLFMIGASYAECDQIMVVVMFIIGMSLMGTSYPSIMVNNLDLSPNYAGTLMAIGNSVAALGGIMTPYIVGVFTPEQTIHEWRRVFWIVLIISVLSNIFFLLYASGEVQEWDSPDFLRSKKKAAAKEVSGDEAITEKPKSIITVDLESARF
ncbi:sialin-like isoform X1 [Nasonia vitripennis]|uniref:Major facilitator superfamily (MFS) profile domain-containing protein n=1 Tax=Nasonia vitripennis TaxID=7425 RepID=A0A7M7IM98_NASVI|nr:sialin-like isoform X1 [Nasonia vitripennis]